MYKLCYLPHERCVFLVLEILGQNFDLEFWKIVDYEPVLGVVPCYYVIKVLSLHIYIFTYNIV